MSQPKRTAAAARSSRVSDNGRHYTVAVDLAGSDRATVYWHDVPDKATTPVRCWGVVLFRYTVTCDEHPGFSATMLLGSPESDPYDRPHTGTQPDSVYVHSLACTWTGVVDATWRLPVTKLLDAAIRAGAVQGVWYPPGTATPSRSATSNSRGTIYFPQDAYDRGPINSAADWVDRWDAYRIDEHRLAELAGLPSRQGSSTDPAVLRPVHEDVLPAYWRLKSTDSLPRRNDGEPLTIRQWVTMHTGIKDGHTVIKNARLMFGYEDGRPPRKNDKKPTGPSRRQTRKKR